MKKCLSMVFALFIIGAFSSIMLGIDLLDAKAEVNIPQSDFLSAAYAREGNSWANSMCLAWVKQFWEDMGGRPALIAARGTISKAVLYQLLETIFRLVRMFFYMTIEVAQQSVEHVVVAVAILVYMSGMETLLVL